MTCQGQPQLLHLSSPVCLPELWPWIWPVESVALLLSSGRHTPATAPAHPDARAQPCVDCAVPLGELSALFPSHLRQEPRCFSFEGASWRRAEFPHPFLQPQCCLQCSLEREGDRVQAEHDARPPFLALDFPARLRSAVPDVRYQLHWCALQHSVLPVLSQSCHVFCSQLLRRSQAAQERYPHVHERGTELLLSVCALCFGLVLDCASGVVVAPTCLCHCFGHVFRAWDQVCLEHCGGQVSQFCRVDQRQSSQHVHQASQNLSLAAPFCHRLSHRSPTLALRSLFRLAFPPSRRFEIH